MIESVRLQKAENGWLVTASYRESGQFFPEKVWVETSAKAAADRALLLMREDHSQAIPIAQQ